MLFLSGSSDSMLGENQVVYYLLHYPSVLYQAADMFQPIQPRRKWSGRLDAVR